MLIQIVAFNDANVLDVCGPAQVFTTANERLATIYGARNQYRIQLVSAAGGLVRTTSGIGLSTLSIDDVHHNIGDTILVAGGRGAKEAGRNTELSAWLQEQEKRARRFGCICTGAFLLAEAGMLRGRRVATHWAYCDQLQSENPESQVERDAIFLMEKGFWSSAGVTAGMDLALAMVEEDHGRHLALDVARRLVLYLKRSGGQSQFSTPLQAQAATGRLSELLEWITNNPAADCRVERLAEQAHMSERTLHRLFAEECGKSPSAWVEQVRSEVARRLLEEGHKSVERVATEAGFSSRAHLRRIFLKRFGVAPTAYKERFAPANLHDPEFPLCNA